MRKFFDFHGGVHPPQNKKQSTQDSISSIPLAKKLVLALNQHIGAPATPVVSVGDKVLKGQLIAEAQNVVSANIHAPSSGKVSAIEPCVSNHASGMPVLSIVIDTDGNETWLDLSPNENPFSLERDTIIENIRAAGIIGMGGAGFPTSVKLGGAKIETLLLNAAECEPYITADDMLLREHSVEVVKGAHLLAKAFPGLKEILIGIEDNKPEAIQALQTAIHATLENDAENLLIELVTVPTKYPSGGEKQLIKLLTGKEVPSGEIPANIGIVMQNVGTCRAVWRALRYGEPLINRVTTVVGKALTKEGNFEIPIGTPVKHILAECGYKAEQNERMIIGGPMMGWAIENTNAPLLKSTNCILIPSKSELPLAPAEQACIRCGLCAEACPAELLPQQLYWYARAEDQEKLKAYNLFDCIECGACSYVCPSSIPLVQYYRAAKGVIRHTEQEKHKSDQARLRFEARQARIAKAEAEKEAKRQQRKKAAEEAKKKLATPKAADTPNPANKPDRAESKSDLVNAALAAAKESSPLDAQKNLARLERSLSSAESRLERAKMTLQKNIEEGAEQTRVDGLSARVMEAEQKVREAQKKIEDTNV